MKVLYYKKDKAPEVLLIPRDLKMMQDLVGGRTECYQVNEKILIICNADAFDMYMPANRRVLNEEGNIQQIIRGNFFVCGAGEHDYISLTQAQIRKIINSSEGDKYPGWIQ